MMCCLRSAYAEAFDHRDVNMVNGISLGIVADIVVELARGPVFAWLMASSSAAVGRRVRCRIV